MMPEMENDLMKPADVEAIVTAYRRGLKSDIVQGRINAIWGAVWTVPPVAPEAMEQVGRQMTRSRAERVRHFRLARLQRPTALKPTDADFIKAVILTELPSCVQIVVQLPDGKKLRLETFLEDDTLAALRHSFIHKKASQE